MKVRTSAGPTRCEPLMTESVDYTGARHGAYVSPLASGGRRQLEGPMSAELRNSTHRDERRQSATPVPRLSRRLRGMQAETRTLTQLFQLDVRYVIPLYQRPYVWTEQRQWSPLWEDIATVAEHVLVEGASSKSPAHFLGAIVIEQEENPPGSPQRYLVIDGQQRLTTLQLLRCGGTHRREDGLPRAGRSVKSTYLQQ